MRTPQSTSTVTPMTENCPPLDDGAEADETIKAKQKELDRLAEFGVNETEDIPAALGKKRVATRRESDHKKDGIRARRKRVQGRRKNV